MMEVLECGERIRDTGFDFKGIPASSGVYGIHPYPAMFHFMVVRELIKGYSTEKALVLDPFVGSGVSAVECLISGRNFVGFDINPLAILIAKVRATPIPRDKLMKTLHHILRTVNGIDYERVDFPNINYWFKDYVIEDLSKLRSAILQISEEDVQDFYKVVFSETVRRVSNTKFNEFKLVRKNKDENPQTFEVFRSIALRNILLLTSFYKKYPPKDVLIKLEEKSLFDMEVEDNSVDLIITSPPYGDSRTTVAYGQFSRLSLRWLGMEERVDKNSLGGRKQEIHYNLPSHTLYFTLDKLQSLDKNRAKEVFSFYADLYKAISLISKKVKPSGYVCFVVGNRKVKGLNLPTDVISAEFFVNEGFKHIKTIVREISNKRMPVKNSPSNLKGDTDFTMKYEYIVVLRKQ